MPPKKKGPSHRKIFNKHDAIPYADDNGDNGTTEYAKVIKTLGDCRFACLVGEGSELCGHLSGRVKKRGRIVPGDIVLVSRREFESATRKQKLDILWKYNEDTARSLLKNGELEFTKTAQDTEIDEAFIFQDEGVTEEDNPINLDDI